MSRREGVLGPEGSSVAPTTALTLALQEGTLIWTWQETLLSIPLGLIVIGTILGNFLVLYSALTRFNTLRLPTHYIIANLALADFLVGVLVMPFLATLQVTGNWYFGPIYCEAWTVIHFWLCAASILSTCAVCIERYIGVRYPHNHKSIMNTHRIWGLIMCVWVLAGLLAFGSLYIWPQPKSSNPYVCPINQQIGHVIMAVVGILYIPAGVMIILYARIYFIASKHLNAMKKHTVKSPPQSDASSKSFASVFRKKPNTYVDDEESTVEISVTTSTSQATSDESESVGQKEKETNPSKSGSNALGTPSVKATANTALVKNDKTKKQINLARRLSILVGVLLASYLPFFTLYMVMAFKPGSISPRVFNTFGWIRYFNSCLNPLIYAWAVPAYRTAMSDMIRKLTGFQASSGRK